MKPEEKAREELKTVSSILLSETEIKQKRKWYKDTLAYGTNLATALRAKASTLDDKSVEYNRFMLEASELDATNQTRQKMFSFWEGRGKTFDATFANVTEQCNKNFDTLLKAFKEAANENSPSGYILKGELESYLKDKDKDLQRNKNKFFVHMQLRLIDIKKYSVSKN